MMKWLIVGALLALVAGCDARGRDSAKASPQGDVIEQREARLQAALADSNVSADDADEPVARWLLPAELAEISGLALTPDGRLFTHNDESARISEIDYRKGTVTKFFFAGEKGLHADFEGLTFANDRFWMLASNGVLYEFAEGAQGQRVDVTVHDTHLGKECEFEGIAWDANAGSFVLSCKTVGKNKTPKDLVLYRWRPGAEGGSQVSQVSVPQGDLRGEHHWKALRPTDITVDPANGNYVLVDAQEHALIAITPDGKPVLAHRLRGQHPQPEGVAITRDHILIIGDESTNSAATITLYRWPEQRGN
ncbi:MAG TPA: hypothetical protein VF247_04350 [Candidatus Krumholzibacteria bacterium]